MGLVSYKLEKEQTCRVPSLYLLFAKIVLSWKNVFKMFMESTEKNGTFK